MFAPRPAAESFCAHRKAAAGFTDFPGQFPETLDEAYAIQRTAIEIWDRPIAGWKVGRILGQHEEQHGENRFLGPIFHDSVWPVADEGSTPFPATRGGFAALEAELVAIIDGPATTNTVTPQQCADLVREWRFGIEVAGSALATIGDLGPLASIAGFGNNMGLVLGDLLDGAAPDDVLCTTVIEGQPFGPKPASALPGGPLAAIAYAVNKLRELGHPIEDGTMISTGAITGVHPVEPGQVCEVRFEPGQTINCEVTIV